ncbi:MAG: hypothetical protein IPH35_07300 [Rhodoferax sp.]|nr:hypothetical protein [Rhodoferax sp.]
MHTLSGCEQGPDPSGRLVKISIQHLDITEVRCGLAMHASFCTPEPFSKWAHLTATMQYLWRDTPSVDADGDFHTFFPHQMHVNEVADFFYHDSPTHAAHTGQRMNALTRRGHGLKDHQAAIFKGA